MKTLPRITFSHLPTPVEPMENLSAHLNGPKIWVKRDDQTGLAFGGNKTRKLEFLLAEALANGAKTLLTGGAVQSNHCRQTAALACKFGLQCVLVLSKDETQPIDQDISGNLLLDHLFGAEINWTTPQLRDLVLQNTFDDLWQKGRRPYFIPVGGSNPTGSYGYANAIEELYNQTLNNRSIPFPNSIVVASSSGGTQAGLVAGKYLFNYPVDILGISIDKDETKLKNSVAKLAIDVCDLVGVKKFISSESIHVNIDFLGNGYGVMGLAEKEAIQLFARKEGLLLDPVYTGRAATGLIHLISKGFFRKSDTVLFWHTGGGPALFANAYKNLIG